MEDFEELIEKASSGDPVAQYNLSVHYLQSGNPDDMPKAYEYCYQAFVNGCQYAANNLGLMYMNGTSPVWDAIMACDLLTVAMQNGSEDAEESLKSLLEDINAYEPYAKLNPVLPLTKVSVIKGVKDAIVSYRSGNTQDFNGFLTGRLGSIPNYQMIEIIQPDTFQSMGGIGLKGATNGVGLKVTFVQTSKEPTRASLEEAYFYTRFRHLDVYSEFKGFFSRNFKNGETTADIWEFVVDCGNDIDKAEKIASSVLYHIYGYKADSFMYPAIKLEGMHKHIQITPAEYNKDSVALLYHNIEQINWIDIALMIIGAIAPFFVYGSNQLTAACIFAVVIPLVILMYGNILYSGLKTMRFPKRNYIRFLLYPNAEW